MADPAEQQEATGSTAEPNNNEENDNNNNVGQQQQQQLSEQQTTPAALTTPTTLSNETQTEQEQSQIQTQIQTENQIQQPCQNQLIIERPPALPPRPPNLVLPHAAIPPNTFPPPPMAYHGKKTHFSPRTTLQAHILFNSFCPYDDNNLKIGTRICKV